MTKEYGSILEKAKYIKSYFWIFSEGTSICLKFLDICDYLTSI